MKVIDLYNKIANEEEVPEKIKFRDIIYELKERNYHYYSYKDSAGTLFEEDWFLSTILNDKIEILDEDYIKDKKIEHINKVYDLTDFRKDYPIVAEMLKDLSNKQYELIDKVNGDTNE
jgi:hypothetical protein